MTTIAILIPAFNSAKTIAETLRSIQVQESALAKVSAVYLADDCSMDETVSVAKATWKVPIPLRVLKGERNLGPYGNINRALREMKENVDWILFFDSDDIAKPNWLKMVVSRIERCPRNVGTICSSCDVLLRDGSVIPGEEDYSRSVVPIDGTLQAVRSTLLRGCWWHKSGAAVRMRTLEDVGDFRPELTQLGDWEWLLRCLHRGWGVEYIPRTLFVYRQHEGSTSFKNFQRDEDIRQSLKIVKEYTWALSRRDLLYFHLKREWYAVRRIGRALTQFRVNRCFQVSKTMALTGLNLLHCLLKKV